MKITPILLSSNKQIRKINANNINHFKSTPYVQDSVSFSGNNKKNSLSKRLFREDVENFKNRLSGISKNKSALSFEDIKSAIAEKIEVKTKENAPQKDYIDTDRFYASTNEHLGIKIKQKDGLNFVDGVNVEEITLFVPENLTANDIPALAHEYTHIKQAQKEPAVEMRTVIDHLKRNKLNYPNAVINMGRLFQDGINHFQGSQILKLSDYYMMINGTEFNNNFGEVINPQEDLEKIYSANNKKHLERILASEIDKEISEVSEHLLINLPEFQWYYLQNPDKAKKVIKTGFKEVYKKVIEKELAAYSNECKVVKELNNINYQVPFDTLVELYAELEKSFDLLGY